MNNRCPEWWIGAIGAFVLTVGTPDQVAADASDPTASDALRWSVDTRVGWQIALDGSPQGGLVLGAGLSYAPIPIVAFGVSLEGSIGQLNTEGHCYYGGNCFDPYGAALLFADLHPLPDFAVDPWVGAGLGVALVGSASERAWRSLPLQAAMEASASLGVNFQIWRLRIGPYGQAVTFTGRQPSSLGFGARAGFRW